MTVIDQTLTVSAILAPLSADDLEQVALYCDNEATIAVTLPVPVAAWWTALAAAIRGRTSVSVATLSTGLGEPYYRSVGGRLGAHAHPLNQPNPYPQTDPGGHLTTPPLPQTWVFLYLLEALVSWGALQGFHPYGGLDPYWWRLRSRNPYYLDDIGNMDEPEWWLG